MLPIEKILCPTDFSEASHEAIKTACELTTHFGSELILLHVVAPVSILTGPEPILVNIPDEQELLISSEKSLQEVLNQIELKELKTRLIVRRGNAADEIAHTAEIEEVDLVVIATHGQTGFNHLLFGSVAEKVVRITRCPVLVIHDSATESRLMEDKDDKGLGTEAEADSKTYQEAIESQIKDLGAKLDGLRTKLEDIKDQAKGRYQSQMEDLRTKGEDAQKKLGQLKESGGEAWEELKTGLFDLRHAFDRAVSKFKEKDEGPMDTISGMRRDYERWMENRLNEWETRIQDLKVKVEASQSEVKSMYANQIESLRVKQVGAKEKLRELRQAGEGAWDDIRKGVDDAAEDLGKAIKAAIAKFKE